MFLSQLATSFADEAGNGPAVLRLVIHYLTVKEGEQNSLSMPLLNTDNMKKSKHQSSPLSTMPHRVAFDEQ